MGNRNNKIKRQIKIIAVSRIYSAIEIVPESKAAARLRVIRNCYLDARRRELRRLYDFYKDWQFNPEGKAEKEFERMNKLKVSIEVL